MSFIVIVSAVKALLTTSQFMREFPLVPYRLNQTAHYFASRIFCQAGQRAYLESHFGGCVARQKTPLDTRVKRNSKGRLGALELDSVSFIVIDSVVKALLATPKFMRDFPLAHIDRLHGLHQAAHYFTSRIVLTSLAEGMPCIPFWRHVCVKRPLLACV